MDKAIHQPVMSIVVGVSNEPVQESSASSNGNYKAKGGNNGAGNAMNTSPRRTYGYSFNNGNAKQPILRAHECNLVEEEVINRNVLPGAVGLNFNFWMEHNYIVDRDVTDLALGALNNKRSSRIVRQDTANKVSNVLVLSIQGVDPRELNDSILDLPFLNCLSSMPIRHVHEESSPLISFDEPAYAQSNTDQQWQYLEVCNQNAKLLWCDKPSVRLSSIAGLATTELLTQYTLTFLVRVVIGIYAVCTVLISYTV